jgi:hypothetical protein
MYVCMYVCMSICTHDGRNVSATVFQSNMSLSWGMNIYVCMYVNTHDFVLSLTYMYMYVHIHNNDSMRGMNVFSAYFSLSRICVYVYMCVYIYTHTHLHTHIQGESYSGPLLDPVYTYTYTYIYIYTHTCTYTGWKIQRASSWPCFPPTTHGHDDDNCRGRVAARMWLPQVCAQDTSTHTHEYRHTHTHTHTRMQGISVCVSWPGTHDEGIQGYMHTYTYIHIHTNAGHICEYVVTRSSPWLSRATPHWIATTWFWYGFWTRPWVRDVLPLRLSWPCSLFWGVHVCV